MSSQPLAVRPRPSLVRSLRTVQVLTCAAGAAFLPIVLFADPGHRLAFAAIDAFSVLVHLILK